MVTLQKDSLGDLQRLHTRLQGQLATARASLLHWQKWDADYEALKEQVQAASATESLQALSDEFSGLVIPRKELDEIFLSAGVNGKTQKRRTPDEVVSTLDHRLEYVGRNVETLSKQADALEDKMAKVEILLSPEVDGEEDGGLPLTEIVEELDEDDNVISSRLQRPGEAGQDIRDLLKRAGVELPEGEERAEKTTAGGVDTAKAEPNDLQEAANGLGQLQLEDKTPQAPASKAVVPAAVKTTDSTKPLPPPPQTNDPKPKGVSFADDTKPGHEPASKTARHVERIMKAAQEQENVSQKRAVLPADEPEDDAALRRDMLQYTMGEVGAVVAELEIEEGDDDYDSDDFEYDLTEDEYEDEDKWGRNKHSFIDDGHRQRMRELEQMYGVQSRFTQGDDGEGDEVGMEGVGRIVVKQGKQNGTQEVSTRPPLSSALATETKEKDTSEGSKSVRFASSLDIAPVEQAATPPAANTTEPIAFADPTSDVIERAAPKPSTQKAPRKASRFKKDASSRPANADDAFFEPPKGPLDAPARFLDGYREDGGAPAPTPTGPKGKTLIDKLVEKEPSAPRDTDELEGEFEGEADSELRAEHRRLRNKFMYKQGGFLEEDTREVVPVDEDGGQRMSRFKAARLGALG